MCALKFQQSSSDDSSDGTASPEQAKAKNQTYSRISTASSSSNVATGEAHTRYEVIRVGEVADAEALALTAGPHAGREPDRSKSIVLKG